MKKTYKGITTSGKIFNDLNNQKTFLLKFIKKFPFPLQSRSEEDFYQRLQNDLNEIELFLISESKSLSWICPFIQIFQENKNQTLKFVKTSLENKNDEANNAFEALMKNTKIQETLNLDQKSFFRIRPGESEFQSKMEIFHISFKERRNCKSNRFSTLGSPALYLGDSIELCVSEIFVINRSKSSFRVSCFRNQKEIKLLSIRSPQEIYNKLYDFGLNSLWTIKEFLENLPITIACLYKTPAPHNFHFNPEYIVPQMLMKHIFKESKLSGIKYPSTKFLYSIDQKPVYNYAFPAKKPNKDGYCDELLGLFDWTEPILSNQYPDIKTLEYNLKVKAKEIKIDDEFENRRNGYRKVFNSYK